MAAHACILQTPFRDVFCCSNAARSCIFCIFHRESSYRRAANGQAAQRCLRLRQEIDGPERAFVSSSWEIIAFPVSWWLDLLLLSFRINKEIHRDGPIRERRARSVRFASERLPAAASGRNARAFRVASPSPAACEFAIGHNHVIVAENRYKIASGKDSCSGSRQTLVSKIPYPLSR